METWLPVLTLFLGFATASLTDFFRDQRALAREREARAELRRENALLRRNEFQRSTLLDLQNAIAKFVRFTGAAHHQDAMEFKRTGNWKKNLLTSDVNDGLFESQSSIRTLLVRADDRQIRDVSDKIIDVSVCTMTAQSKEGAEQNLMELANLSGIANTKIGEGLRKLDAVESEIIA